MELVCNHAAFFFLEPIFAVLKMPRPVYPVFVRLFLALAFIFGTGYYEVSRNLDHNDTVVKMGIIGKTCVFIGLFYNGIRRRIHPLLIIPGIVDLVFAVLFLDFLRQKKHIEHA